MRLWRQLIRRVATAVAPVVMLAATPATTLAAETGQVQALAAFQAATDRGWVEAVVSVSRAQPMLEFAQTVAGWDLKYRGSVAPSVLGFYEPGGSASRVVHRDAPTHGAPQEWLVGDHSGTPGLLRLIAFNNPHSVQIRSGAQPWDTGGILSIMTRSNATAAVYRAAQSLGWNAFNDPVVLNLPDTGVKLTNVIVRGPDGVNVSVYERLIPRMPDDPDLRKLRHPFNSMQSVRSIERARDFYVQVLGFELLNKGNFANPVREPNNFGVPANLVPGNPLPFAIVGPTKDGPTQVELLEFRGIEGRDLTANAVPPNLGILALRFPVSDLSAIQKRLAGFNWPIARAPTTLQLAPYGQVAMLAVQSPDGAWLEFVQLAPGAQKN